MQRYLFGDLELKEQFSHSEQLINNISKALKNLGLINKNEITPKDIERLSIILSFCIEAKNETDILELTGLKCRSSKLIASIKACVEAGLLNLHMKNLEGNIVSEYALTEFGKLVIEVDSN